MKGSVLVLALWVLTMLSIFALSLGLGVRQRAALLERLSTLDALYPIAYSGVEKAKSLVNLDSDTVVDTLLDPWAASGAGQEDLANGFFLLGDAERPGLVDEERKINLNAASLEVLSRLLQIAAGLSREQAEEIAYCLIDWMDSDSFFGHPQYGAETAYYDNLRAPYRAADKPYELLDEMVLVKGMTPEIFQKIRPFVTVYGSGQVNMNTAPREVLRVLGFSPEGAELIARYRSGADGIEGNSDDNFFSDASAILTDLATKGDSPLDDTQEVVLGGLLEASRVGVASTAFSVVSHAVLAKNQASMDIEAVIDRQGRIRYSRASEVKL